MIVEQEEKVRDLDVIMEKRCVVELLPPGLNNFAMGTRKSPNFELARERERERERENWGVWQTLVWIYCVVFPES